MENNNDLFIKSWVKSFIFILLIIILPIIFTYKEECFWNYIGVAILSCTIISLKYRKNLDINP